MSSLQRLELQGFRGFAKREFLELATPRDGEIGSGLTILVGPNNTGKSSVLESLAFLTLIGEEVQLTEAKKNRTTFDHVEIVYEYDDRRGVRLATQQPGGNRMSWTWNSGSEGSLPHSTYVVPSRRPPSELIVTSNAVSRHDFSRVIARDYRGPHLSNFGSRLAAAANNRVAFDAITRRVIGTPLQWSLEQHDQQPTEYRPRYRAPAGAPHNLEALGDGISRVQQLADSLFDAPKGEMILIDEPEQSLHPAAQRRLAMLLAEESMRRQVVISTHSTAFVDWKWMLRGARLARTFRDGEKLGIANLSTSCLESLRGLLGDRSNLHRLGTDATETLFQEDGIIVCEGQEDVWGYRRIAEQLETEIPGEFFGWGAGGAKSMPAIIRLLNELRFQRVVGILDRGEESTAKALSSEFPSYEFIVSPADDVRVKESMETSKLAFLRGGELQASMRVAAVDLMSQLTVALSRPLL